ncbi:unnamed protein product [Parnassius mnemosyne]|uniref:Double jelly roll-like domain-containing protein n=1 Tax=Parnassius mnemosyne TaxID=213953 RepID=A0AAV1LC99_9NEOP
MTMFYRRTLTNLDILEHASDIPYFRGVFMRNNLPLKPRKIECGILNLDSYRNSGTHWVAFVKHNKYVEYYDSFEPLMGLKEFRDVAPLFIIDCSRQHETLKGSIDVRVEIETDQEIPDQTTAYCLIINDCIFEYKPLSNIVKKTP